MGTIAYCEAQNVQERLFEKRLEGSEPDTLLLLEHDHVLTLGRSADDGNVLSPAEELRADGVAVERTGRGGDVTYHGPGQLVVYPVISLKEAGMGVTDYVSALEETVILLLGSYGLSGARDPRNRGVWMGNSKIAAIGLRIRRQISIHGLALNVRTDLSMYDRIVPCGIADAGVTSLLREGCDVSMADVKAKLADIFLRTMGYTEGRYVDRAYIEKAGLA